MTLEVGMRASRTRQVTTDDIDHFAQVSGDNNPVHLDDDYAQETQFGGRIAHGMYTVSIISAILGNDLPGRGTIYLGQDIQFKAPVRPGDTITATVECIKYRAARRIATFKTTATNQDGTVVVTGEAVVLAPAGTSSTADE